MNGDRDTNGSSGSDRAHPDPVELALAALPAEPPDPAVAAHLMSCARCRQQVHELTRTVALAQDASADDDDQPVSERIWAAIAAEIGPELDPVTQRRISSTGDVGARPSSDRTQNDRGDRDHRAGRDRRADTVRTGAALRSPTPPSPVPRARVGVGRAAAAVLVALAIGVGVGVGIDRAIGPAAGPSPGPAMVVAQLVPVGAADPAGRGTLASVERDGVRTMVVHLTGVTDPAGADFLEAWLMNPATHQIVALGALTRDGTGYDGSFTVPANLPMDRLDVVDVSAERYDGDPGHAGVSILRGTLA